MAREPATATGPGVLVRLPITGDRWVEDLPPVPRGFDVTVSFSSAEAAAVHGTALAELGYRMVGVAEGPAPDGVLATDGPVADVLIPGALIAQRPRWWRALKARAARSFGLGFGPVAAALGDVLRLHTPEPRSS